MRVLSITPELPSPHRPGSMAATARQIESLRAMGLEIDTFDMHGFPVLKYVQATWRLRPWMEQCDLIHSHFGYCGWLGRMQRTKPLVISFMGDDILGTPVAGGRTTRISRAIAAINKRLARMADAVIVKSKEMARAIEPVRSHVIPNGVDMNEFHPRETECARRELGWTERPRRILFPGNPANPRKGFPLAEAAVRVAEGKLREPLEIVPLWGVPPERVALYMNACDALIMVSFIEGSPNAVKEAMACDLRGVAVPVGDVVELLDGVSGYRIGPRDPEALGQLLAETLLDDGPVAGRQSLLDRGLDLDGVARKVIEVYHEVLGLAISPTGSPSRREPAAYTSGGAR